MGIINRLVTALPPRAVCTCIILCASYVKDPVLELLGVKKCLVLLIRVRVKFSAKISRGGCLTLTSDGPADLLHGGVLRPPILTHPDLTYNTGQGREALRSTTGQSITGDEGAFAVKLVSAKFQSSHTCVCVGWHSSGAFAEGAEVFKHPTAKPSALYPLLLLQYSRCVWGLGQVLPTK